MATCPTCTSKINDLVCHKEETFKLSSEGDNTLIATTMVWKCPNCGETLFSGFPEGEAEAREWLAQ